MIELTRADLAQAGCETPDCGHDHSVLYLNARCHPGRGLEMRVACGRCQAPVFMFKVAE